MKEDPHVEQKQNIWASRVPLSAQRLFCSYSRNNTCEHFGTMSRKEQKRVAYEGTRTWRLSVEPQCRFALCRCKQNEISQILVPLSSSFWSSRCIFWWGIRIRCPKMGTWQHFVQDGVFSMFILSPGKFIKTTFFILYWFVIYSSRRIFWATICGTFDPAERFDSPDATRPQRVWRNIETL